MQLLSDETNRCATQVIDVIPDVMWFIRRQMRGHRKGLSVPQFRTLIFVETYPQASLSVIADHLAIPLPTASRLVSGLVRQRLLTRRRCTNDRRQLRLAITPRGKTVSGHARAATHRHMAGQLQRLDDRQRHHLHQAMAALRQVFGAMGWVAGHNGKRA